MAAWRGKSEMEYDVSWQGPCQDKLFHNDDASATRCLESSAIPSPSLAQPPSRRAVILNHSQLA